MSYSIETAILSLDKYARSWRSFVGTEITDKSGLGDVLEPLSRAFYKEYGQEQSAAEEAIAYYVVAKFLCYKTIYRFEPSFLNALSQTEDSCIYQASLKNLPVSCFFIALNSQPYLGLIVCVDFLGEDTHVTVSMIPNGNIESTAGNMLTLSIHDGQTITAAISEWHKDNDELIDGTHAVNDSDAVRILTLATQAAYYLSARNCAIKKINIPKEKRPKRSNGTPLNLREWNVGYRIGNAFAPTQEPSSEILDSTGTATHGTSPRPHVRRAHFHHYWVGQGRARCEVRWIDPVWVNGDSESIVPTEHQVL